MGGMAGRNVSQPARVKLTYDDFVLFPDDGLRHELIDGEHYVTPSPNKRHQQLVGRVHLAIGKWLEAHPVGEVFLAPFDVVFTRFDVVEPDLLYIASEHASVALTDLHAKAADLVVEIASPGTRSRDEVKKRLLYERCGVEEYWLVDPDADTVRVYRRSRKRFSAPEELRADTGDVLTTALLSGFTLSLAALFRRTTF